MTLTTLVIRIAIAALLYTGVVGFLKKEDKSWVMLFAQGFCGILFLFSGWVKAVDPLGTAYKMEQYFDEFYLTFADTAMSFVAPLFPLLNDYSIGFSVFMIVFEIVLGIMLLTGTLPKWTSWLFFLLVAFFTVLTGFTFLTGYVPSGQNFFAVGEWGAYKESNMRVTDCGCFGDFLKLKPRLSFFKDIFLLVPSIYFVLRSRDMVQLFTKPVRLGLLGASTIGLLIYCFSNYSWDLPHADFRPFSVGTDVADKREQEMDAAANVDIYAWLLQDKATGAKIEVPSAEYYSKLSGEYSRDKVDVLEQLKTEPTIEMTKVSEFEVTDLSGNDVSYEYLDNPQKHYMIVAHKLKAEVIPTKVMVTDTTYSVDTVMVDGESEPQLLRSVAGTTQREVTQYTYEWDPEYIAKYKEVIAPLAAAAKAKGYGVSIVAGADAASMRDLAATTGINVPLYTADDILLKTIVRSNPGIVLWQDGKVVNKWHHKKFDRVE